MSTIRSTVETTLRDNHRGDLLGYVGPIVTALENQPDRDAQTVIDHSLRAHGYSSYVGSDVARRVATAVNALRSQGTEAVASPDTPLPGMSFDRETAAHVIRTFIGDDYDAEDVDALLIIAGIQDEPEPEPVVEDVAVDAGLFRRLVDFARGHGFRG